MIGNARDPMQIGIIGLGSTIASALSIGYGTAYTYKVYETSSGVVELWNSEIFTHSGGHSKITVDYGTDHLY